MCGTCVVCQGIGGTLLPFHMWVSLFGNVCSRNVSASLCEDVMARGADSDPCAIREVYCTDGGTKSQKMTELFGLNAPREVPMGHRIFPDKSALGLIVQYISSSPGSLVRREFLRMNGKNSPPEDIPGDAVFSFQCRNLSLPC